MKYPKAFEKYYNRAATHVPGVDETYQYSGVKHIAYHAWKAGRKFQQNKPQPIKWGYHCVGGLAGWILRGLRDERKDSM